MSIDLLCAKLAMDAAGEGITIADLSQELQPIIYVNNGFTRLTGYSIEETLGKNCRFLQGKETTQSSIDGIRTAITTRSYYTCEIVNYRKNGSLFWNRLTLAPFQENGVDYMVGVQMDLTSEKLAMAAQVRLLAEN